MHSDGNLIELFWKNGLVGQYSFGDGDAHSNEFFKPQLADVVAQIELFPGGGFGVIAKGGALFDLETYEMFHTFSGIRRTWVDGCQEIVLRDLGDGYLSVLHLWTGDESTHFVGFNHIFDIKLVGEDIWLFGSGDVRVFEDLVTAPDTYFDTVKDWFWADGARGRFDDFDDDGFGNLLEVISGGVIDGGSRFEWELNRVGSRRLTLRLNESGPIVNDASIRMEMTQDLRSKVSVPVLPGQDFQITLGDELFLEGEDHLFWTVRY